MKPASRRLHLLVAAQGVTGFGDFLSVVAIPFAMLVLDPSGLLTGLVLASRTVPQVVMLFAGSVLVDRLDPRRLMIGADVVLCLTQVAIGAVLVSGRSSVFLLCALFAVNGAASALYIPAVHKLLPVLVERDQLQRANATLSLTFTVVGLVSFPVGGLLVTVLSPGFVILLDGVTFLVSALLVGTLGRPEPAHPVEAADDAPTPSWWRELGDGVRAVTRSPWLVAGLINAGLFQMLVLGMLPVLGPLIAEQRLGGATGWSVLLTATAVGMLAGGLLLRQRTTSRPLLLAYTATALGVPPGLVALALGLPLGATAGLLGLYGLGLAIFNTLWDTALQQRVPGALLGRVSALDGFVSYAFRPVGLVLAAPLAALVGAPNVLLGAAAVVGLASVVLVAVPPWRGESRRTPVVDLA